MPIIPCRFPLLLVLLATSPVLRAAPKSAGAPDTAPQLLSTDGGSRWQTTKELRAAAARGEADACFELGTRLLDGDEEIVRNPPAARALLETAAAGGVANAHFRLGKIYHDGRDVPRDYARALAYYTTAARLGVPEAQHNLGAMLVSARGVKRDFVEGLAWLLVAEKSGAASEAPQRVRDQLARRPAEIHAAELRAQEIAADLPNAVVRAILKDPPAAVLPPAAGEPRPAAPTLVAPKIDPPAPPKVEIKLDAPLPTPR